jgi:hypothetical protein
MSAAKFDIGPDRVECARKAVVGTLALAPVVVHQLEGLAENGAAMEMVCRIEQLAGLALTAVDDDIATAQHISELQRGLCGNGANVVQGNGR